VFQSELLVIDNRLKPSRFQKATLVSVYRFSFSMINIREQVSPNLLLTAFIVLGVSSPVDTNDGNVLQKYQIKRQLEE
jgi:hypothetical protein